MFEERGTLCQDVNIYFRKLNSTFRRLTDSQESKGRQQPAAVRERLPNALIVSLDCRTLGHNKMAKILIASAFFSFYFIQLQNYE
jgi:hypothetical protein